MILHLKRKRFNEQATIGELYIDDNKAHQCFTLEDVFRDKKIEGQSAIPEGRYEVVISYSNRFQKLLPLLLNVPNFEGIRIHPGNTDKDTEGCILVGRYVISSDFIGDSRAAFFDLYPLIKRATEVGKVFINITNEKKA